MERQQECVLLLVEDNPADAELVQALLDEDDHNHYKVMHVTRMSEAIDRLRNEEIDVMLLDLRLPDASGVETVRSIKLASRSVPIVVLTGTDEQDMGLSCIDAGAQDFMRKDELRPVILRKAIEFAMTRLKESSEREAAETLMALRSLTSETLSTIVTGSLAGTGPLKDRDPAFMAESVQRYTEILSAYIEYMTFKTPKPREEMEVLVSSVGIRGGGPRDLMDLHIAALDETVLVSESRRRSSTTTESRLLALELMGILVDFYRVGLRRLGAKKEQE